MMCGVEVAGISHVQQLPFLELMPLLGCMAAA
jgi:hypothetical protein